MDATDFDSLVEGCDAVLHLAAETHAADRMMRLNVETTRQLVEAGERGGLKSFCYVSSVAVYGSGTQRVTAEDAPVLTVDRDVRSEYWVVDYVRTYGRTKLAGELVLRRAARSCHYVVMRPTVVVDVPEIIAVRYWSKIKRILAAHRHAHHIYVRDVSLGLIWALERGLSQSNVPGSVEVFNLSEDEFEEPTYAEFMRKAYQACGDPRFNILQMPAIFDWIRDFVRYRTLPIRNPLWRMIFPNDQLRAAGYTLRYGMAHANKLALQELKTNPDR